MIPKIKLYDTCELAPPLFIWSRPQHDSLYLTLTETSQSACWLWRGLSDQFSFEDAPGKQEAISPGLPACLILCCIAQRPVAVHCIKHHISPHHSILLRLGFKFVPGLVSPYTPMPYANTHGVLQSHTVSKQHLGSSSLFSLSM